MGTKFNSRRDYERWKTRRLTSNITEARKRERRGLKGPLVVVVILLLAALGFAFTRDSGEDPSESDADALTEDATEETEDEDDGDDEGEALVDLATAEFAPAAGLYVGEVGDTTLSIRITLDRIDGFTWTGGDVEKFTWTHPDVVRYTVGTFEFSRNGVTSSLEGGHRGFRVALEEQYEESYFELEGSEEARGRFENLGKQVQGRVFVVVPKFDQVIGAALSLPKFYRKKKRFKIPIGPFTFAMEQNGAKHRVQTQSFVRELRFYRNAKGTFATFQGVRFKLE